MLLTSSVFCSNFSDTSRTVPAKRIYRGSNKRSTDIIHTTLRVSFDWQRSRLNGEAEIIAKPFLNPIRTVFLDARGMDIESVEVFEQKESSPVAGGKTPSVRLNSSYIYKNDSIKIDLGRSLNSEEKFCVKIKYVSKPEELKKGGSVAISDDKGLYFINPTGKDKNKMTQVWTQGETQSSSVWFPTIDSPNEKMTNDIYITVDEKYTTLSNGVLSESIKNTNGTRTDHWVMDLPHSPYLVMMGVGEFKRVNDEPWNGKEISYYVEKEFEPYAKDIFGNTKEMIDFYSRVLDTPFPWQKYSQIVVRDFVSGAMENTTATLHGDFMVYQTAREMLDGKKGEDVISHELFHQWFGDYVTAESWSNLPLNESFATYGEYLWQEYKYGRDAADALSMESRASYFNTSPSQEVDMIRFNYNDKEEMFDQFSYNKGGQILHMLRKYTGDTAFFASLKLYLEKNKFKNAEIHDLRLAFEETTGEDLNWFFNEWFLAKGYPQLDIIKQFDPLTKTVRLKVSQQQDLIQVPLYTLPVEVDIYENNSLTRHRIWIENKEQEFSFNVKTEPALVNFDAERQLLCRKKYFKTDAEYIYQYLHAPLYIDRFEALSALREKVNQENIYAVMVQAAEKDKWHGLRSTAIGYLRSVATKKENELKPLLIKLAKEDKSTEVRSAAISFLAQNYRDANLEGLFEDCLNEQSYLVLASSLQGLAGINGAKAVKAAKKFDGEKNEDLSRAVAFIYSTGGSDENLNFFHKKLEEQSGYERLEFFNYYLSFIEKCKQVASYETLYNDLAAASKNENEYLSGYVKKIIRDEFSPRVNQMPDITADGENFKPLKEKVAAYIK